MRILFVDHTGELGGAELSLVDVATQFRSTCQVLLLADGPLRTRLTQKGIRVSILALPRGVGKVRRSAGVLAALWTAPALILFARKVASLAHEYDILYANTQKALIVLALSRLFQRRPLVWHLRDILDSQHFGPLQRRIAVVAANLHACKVIANSNATASAFVAAKGKKELVAVVPNGIDAGPFESADPARVAALRRAYKPAGAILIGVFGRLTQWKGQHVVIRSLMNLPQVHAIFVGEALFGEADYKEELVELASRLGVGDRVRFLGFREDIPELMVAVDFVVHSSIAPEPFGRVVVEAMLSKRPVIASATGGVLEIVVDRESGLLIPPDNPEELAGAIAALVCDPKFAERLAYNGRNRAVAQFGAYALHKNIREQLESCLI